MLWDTSMMIGCEALGRDGRAGIVSDLLFDDSTWRIRWIVVDTGSTFRHEILLPFAALPPPDLLGRRLAVDLTTRQIADSLPAERHLPVSQKATSGLNDPHLRSVDAVIGHRAHLLDGVVGHVDELLMDDADWIIRYLRVDTCKWRPGEHVLLAPPSVREIDWAARLVRFDVGRHQLEGGLTNPDVIWIRSCSDGTHADTGKNPGTPDEAQAGLSARRDG